jgi:ATP-dependent DNA helicase UvrD/PcrA
VQEGGAKCLRQGELLKRDCLEVAGARSYRANALCGRLAQILVDLQEQVFSGRARDDWLQVKQKLLDSPSVPIREMAEDAEQLVSFQRGAQIAHNLEELWHEQGTYAGARRAFDAAIAEDQLLSPGRDSKGIHVMTIHKAKGKEFDAVIVLDDSMSSPLLSRNDPHPYHRSRKLLRVAITRAKHHVLLLTDASEPTPLLAGHSL